MAVAADIGAQNDASLRLKPEMASRRLLVLAFVREYITRWGQSPSYGEISSGLAISPTRARQLVKALVAGGQLIRSQALGALHFPLCEMRPSASFVNSAFRSMRTY
jgi:hypothetical protein